MKYLKREGFDRANLFGAGQTNDTFSQYFTGVSFLSPTVELKEGVTVVIPANVKHWHGARKDSWFSHISIAAPGVHTDTVWCEHVTDEEYDKLD